MGAIPDPAPAEPPEPKRPQILTFLRKFIVLNFLVLLVSTPAGIFSLKYDSMLGGLFLYFGIFTIAAMLLSAAIHLFLLLFVYSSFTLRTLLAIIFWLGFWVWIFMSLNEKVWCQILSVAIILFTFGGIWVQMRLKEEGSKESAWAWFKSMEQKN